MYYLIITIHILGGVQGFFLSFLLLTLKDRLKANKFLAFMVFTLSVTLTITFLHFTKLILHVPYLFVISQFFTILYGPLLLFYVSHLLIPNYKMSLWQSLHFIPLVIQIKLALPFISMISETSTGYLMNIFEDLYFPLFNIESIGRILHLIIYLSICYRIYWATQKSGNKRGENEKTKLVWIRNLLLSSVFIWGIYTFLYFYNIYLLNFVIPILISIAIYAMGYMGFKYPEIFRSVHLKKLMKKYEFSSLIPQEKDRYCEELLQIMKEQKVFTNSDLSLSELANLVNISPQHLSQIINEKFNQNFSEFINAFRVEEAKKLLLDPNNRHLNILAIAYEAGFNSKSTFNSAFKKATQRTPSEFINNPNVTDQT